MEERKEEEEDMYVCTCICMCVCMCVYVCMYVCMYMCMYAYMHMYVCIIFWGELSGGNVLPKTGGGIVRSELSGGELSGEGMSYTPKLQSQKTEEINLHKRKSQN